MESMARYVGILLLVLGTAGCDPKLLYNLPDLPNQNEQFIALRATISGILATKPPDDETIQQCISALKTALAQSPPDLEKYPDADREAYESARRAAKRELQRVVVLRLRDARDTGVWWSVKGCYEVYQVLDPGNPLYSDAYEKALKMVYMPQLTNRGAYEDEDIYVFFDAFDPKTKDKATFIVREGEVFDDGQFQLLEIVGRNRAYKIRYLAVEDYVFTVEGLRPLPELRNGAEPL